MHFTESTRRRLNERKPRFGVLVTLLVSVILLMFMLKTCSSERIAVASVSKPAGGDTLNVAIEYSPLGVMRQGDSLAGFGYEMINAIAQANHVPIKFTPIVALATTLEEMRAGRYDIVIAQIPMTADFKRFYRLSEPVCIDRQALVQRLDSVLPRVSSQLDLGGKRVSVVAGSPAVERLQSLSREIGERIVIVEDSLYSQEQLFLLVASGEIDYAVVNYSLARQLSNGNERELDVSKDVSFSQFQSWAVNRNDSVVADSIDAMIRRFKASDDYADILSRYSLTPAR